MRRASLHEGRGDDATRHNATNQQTSKPANQNNIMQTELQKTIAKIASNIFIQTLWEGDPDAWNEWRELSKPDNCFDGESRDDWQPWKSEIRVACICEGQEITGSAFLGGTWEKAGDHPALSNPDISGFERQMTEEALRELLNEMSITGVDGSVTPIRDQIHKAIAHLSTIK